MVLTREEIREAVENGQLRIEPYDETNLTTTGYILSAAKVSVPKVHWTVREGYLAVGKHTRFLMYTRERIGLGDGLVATLHLVPNLAAKGILSSPVRLATGHGSDVVVSAFNSSIRTLNISVGMPVLEMTVQRCAATLQPSPGTVSAGGPASDHGDAVPQGGETDGHARASRPQGPPPTALRLDPRDGGRPCLEHECSLCCHETEMPLTGSDLERLEAQGHEDFSVEKDGWVTLRNVDGRCYFLEKDRCTVYKDRPIGCRFYPAVYSADEAGAIRDGECPYKEEFSITDTLERDLERLVDTVQRERRQRRLRGRRVL